MATQDENKALARRYAEVMESGTVDGADAVLSSGLRFHPPGSPAPLDLEAWTHFTRMFQTAFPDLHFTVEEVIAEGDTVAERLRCDGTHRGAFQGLPPTGKQISFTGMTIYRIAGGKIVELWGQFDALGMMQQLGVIPAPAQVMA